MNINLSGNIEVEDIFIPAKNKAKVKKNTNPVQFYIALYGSFSGYSRSKNTKYNIKANPNTNTIFKVTNFLSLKKFLYLFLNKIENCLLKGII